MSRNRYEWWIYYRVSREWEDRVAVLPSLWKLLRWILRYSDRCEELEIVRREA